MKINITNVLGIAKNESKKTAESLGWSTETINTMFVGLMKAATYFPDSSEKEDNAEVKKLYKRISRWDKEPEDLRFDMKDKLYDMVIDEKAENKTYTRFLETLGDYEVADSVMALEKILSSFRTKEIDELLKGTGEPAPGDNPKRDEPKKDNPKKEEPKKGSKNVSASRNRQLENMIEQTNDIRGHLLRKFPDQTNPVNEFMDGLWTVDLNTLANGSKKRPRGVFLFIGAPCIGKTLLIEEASKEMRCPDILKLDMSKFAGMTAYDTLAGRNGILSSFVNAANGKHAFIAVKNLQYANEDVQKLFLQIASTATMKDSDVSFENITLVFTVDIEEEDIRLYGSMEDDKPNSIAFILRSKAGLPSGMLKDRDRNLILYTMCSAGFPAQLMTASRMIFFNDANVQTLEKICRNSFNVISDQLCGAFDMEIEADDNAIASILYSGPADFDARALNNRAKKFVSEEMKKLFSLYKPQSAVTAIRNIDKIKFVTELKDESDEIKSLFRNQEGSHILFFGADFSSAEKKVFAEGLNKFKLHYAEDLDEAEAVLARYDVQAVLMQMDNDIPLWDEAIDGPLKEDDDEDLDYRSQKRKAAKEEKEFHEEDAAMPRTINMFDFIPTGSSDLRNKMKELRRIASANPHVPVYILETGRLFLSQELKNGMMAEGARGFVKKDTSSIAVLVKTLREIGNESYIKSQISNLKKSSKSLKFETVPLFVEDEKTVIIRLKHFELHQVVDTNDKDVDVTASDSIDIRFEDVIGAETAKEELQTFVDYLKNPRRYLAQGTRAPRGVLLYGNPGTGKTMLAKAFAGEAGVAFLSLEGSSVMGKYVGDEQRAIKSLFAKARKYAPSVIFIDEIDVIGRARTGGDSTAHRVQEEALTTLLNEMDGVKSDPARPVFVLAATNYNVNDTDDGIGAIDPALVRRFDRTIMIDLPNRSDRLRFLKAKTEDENIFDLSRKALAELADRSVGQTLAILDNVLELGKRTAYRKNTVVDETILNDAFEEIIFGEKTQVSEEKMKHIAYHEAGHIIISWRNGSIPKYVTITSRASFGGYTFNDSIPDVATRDELLSVIRTSLGGRAAETVAFGDKGITAGIADDLKKANRIAKHIVCEWGMDEDMGLVFVSPEDASNAFYAEKIHNKISKILNTEMEKAVDIITDYKRVLKALSEALLEQNHLSRYEIEEIIEDNR